MSQSKPYLTSTYFGLWWFPLMVGVIILLGSIVVLLPQVSEMRDMNRNLKAANEQLVKAQAKVDQVARLNTDHLDQYTTLVGGALPPQKPYFETFSTLQRLAADTGVALGDFDLDGGSLATKTATVTTTKQGSTRLSTTISIQGTSDQITGFVTALQQSLPLIAVKSFNIGVAGINDIRRAELGVDIYYVLNQGAPTAVSFDPLPQLTETNQSTLNTLTGFTQIAQSASASAITNYDRTDVFSF